jgi:hypothetical protein
MAEDASPYSSSQKTTVRMQAAAVVLCEIDRALIINRLGPH